MKPVISDRTFLYSLLTLPNLLIRVICGQIDFSKTNPIFPAFSTETTIAGKIKPNQTHRSEHSYIRTFRHPSTPANLAAKKDLITLHALHDLHGKIIRVICGQIDFSKTKPIIRVLAAKSTIAAKNKANQTQRPTAHSYTRTFLYSSPPALLGWCPYCTNMLNCGRVVFAKQTQFSAFPQQNQRLPHKTNPTKPNQTPTVRRIAMFRQNSGHFPKRIDFSWEIFYNQTFKTYLSCLRECFA